MELLVLLGPPGSGKGTLSRLLQRQDGFLPVSTGETIRREMADPDSEVGRKSSPFMERGDYIPDALALSLFFSILKPLSFDSRLVLDGFPRTVPQAERFRAWLEETPHRLLGCVFLDLPLETAMERLQRRQVCIRCRMPYHLDDHPPLRTGVCDECGGKLIFREDDDPVRMRQRQLRHREQTLPVRDWFSRASFCMEVDAGQSPEDMRNDLKQALLF